MRGVCVCLCLVGEGEPEMKGRTNKHSDGREEGARGAEVLFLGGAAGVPQSFELGPPLEAR